MNPQNDAASALGEICQQGPSDAAATATFAADLAVFTGHFPGQPLVPGVHQLALVGLLASRALDTNLTLQGIQRCKWTSPLLPAQEVTVRATWQPLAAGQWRVDGQVLRNADQITTCTCRLLFAAGDEGGER